MHYLWLAPYELALLVTVLCLILVWQRRHLPGGRLLLAALGCEAAYTVGYIGELLTPSLVGKICWDNAQWLPSLASVLLMMLFAREYTQKTPLPSWLLLQLGIVPIAIATLAFTNDWHHYIGTGHRMVPGWPVPALYYEFGKAVWITVPYLIGLQLQAMATLFVFMLKRTGVFRKQALGILIGFLIPTVTQIAAMFDFQLHGYRDLGPQATAIGNVFVIWSLLRYRALRLLPFAREQVFDQLQIGVLVVDDSRNVVDANAALANQLKAPLPTLLGESVDGVLRKWPTVLSSLAPGQAKRLELRLPDEAQERWLQVDVQPVNEAGHLGQLLLTRDITEHKLASLEAVRAREAALSASIAKSRFVATLSHEIRTPLAAVMGLSRLLAQTTLDTNQRDLIQKLDSATRHLLELLNHTLDFSKLEAGKLDLAPVDFDLGALLTAISEIFFPGIADKGLRFSLVVEPSVPHALYGDGLRLKQILTNLVGNAVKFTHTGQIGLNVSVREQKGPDIELLFIVTDTGIGLDEAQLQSLFRPFSQADASISHRFGGTGLGLSISSQLAQMLGGSLTCESKKGVGSTFRLTVKLRQSEHTVEPKAAAQPDAAGQTSPTALSPSSNSETSGPSSVASPVGARPLVLLAEDNEVNQLVTQKMLRRLGFECEVVGDGRGVLQQLSEQPFDHYAAVLMDLQMPDIDGRTAVVQLRADPRFDTLPIIALTGESVREVILDVLSCGMDDVLQKPVDLKTLGSVLQRQIRDKRRTSRDQKLRDSLPGTSLRSR